MKGNKKKGLEAKIEFQKATGVWGTTRICTPFGVFDVKDIKEEEVETSKMIKECDWMAEENALIAIYIEGGFTKDVAIDMAQREIEKRKIEVGYPFKAEETK